jgi:hypothetical protein
MWWDEVRDRMEYWADYPPTHVLVRGALGYKGPPAEASPDTLSDAREIASMFGGI